MTRHPLAIILSIIMLLACAIPQARAQSSLRFNPEGKLKIVQFTDIHYKHGKKASRAATEMMEEVLDAEKPDFVIITGDLVYAKGVAEALTELTAPITSRGLPWAMVFGNHDEQFDMTLPAMYDAMQIMPGCIMPPRPIATDSPDYVIDLLGSDGSQRPVGALYCLDSHSGAQVPGIGKYAWLTHDQIGWYRAQSAARTLAAGAPLPSLMFMHIPLQEYVSAQGDTKNFLLGTKGEEICCQAANSGMFASIKEMGDVFGVFCGHDHDNDFATQYAGVLLAYGRYSGGKTVYNHLGKNGARVIVLHEGEPRLDTWLRLRGGDVINSMQFPLPAK